MKSMKNVLITGAAGFIGSNLVDRCVELGWNVDGVDDMSNGHREFVSSGLRNFICDDFSSPKVIELVQNSKYDVIFHLAAVPRVGYSVEHPLETNHINVTKTLELMTASRGNVGRFVFASSSSVYGDAKIIPTQEDAPKSPNSPYAMQKSIIEDYLKIYNVLYDLDSVCLRFFNVFGPRALGTSPYSTALASWLTAIKSNKQMRSDGDGTQSRDLCYVDNVTNACVRAASITKRTDARCYNVANGKSTSNNEILQYLLKRYPGSSYYTSSWRPGDVMHTLADIRNAKLDLDYQPTIDPWEGIERTCDWYDKNWDWVVTLRQGV